MYVKHAVIGITIYTELIVYSYKMTSIEEWRKWIIRQLIGNGPFNVMLEQHIRARAGKYFDTNLDVALNSLVDDGILTYLESNGEARYTVNFDKLDEVRAIMNSEPATVSEASVIQPFMAEPDGYTFWFENSDYRSFRKQNTYRMYKKANDSHDFAAQLITKSMGKVKTTYMGSLSQPHSYISILWRAIPVIAKQGKNGLFILQDLQNQEPKSCGNNRQRGKIALAIFSELGFIHAVETKANSTKYRLGIKKPFDMTLDDILQAVPNKQSADEVNDPEQFGQNETENEPIYPELNIKENSKEDRMT
jgi:hypothetical protein